MIRKFLAAQRKEVTCKSGTTRVATLTEKRKIFGKSRSNEIYIKLTRQEQGSRTRERLAGEHIKLHMQSKGEYNNVQQ
jgi:hypothetical protein